MREHLVYFLRDEQEILYIGVTIRGIDRIRDHAYQKKIPFTAFFAYSFDSEVAAKTFELKMIAFCRPRYNKYKCNSEYVGLRELQKYVKKMTATHIGLKSWRPSLVVADGEQEFRVIFFAMLVNFFPCWLGESKREKYIRKWESIL